MASDENESDTQGYFGMFRDSNNSITSDSKHSKSSKKDKREKTGYQHFTKSSSDEDNKNKKTNAFSVKKSKSSLFKFTNKEKTPKSKEKNGSQPNSCTKGGKPYSALPANFFRLPLEEALKYDCHDDGVPLPTFVRSCIDYIEEQSDVARKEGIYKKSVAKALLEKVKMRYVETGFVDWLEHAGPRSLAPTLLRHYVKHLSLPLIPLCVELTLMERVAILRERQQNLGNHKHDNKGKLADDIQTPLNFIKTTLNEKLPISHWYMLAYLLSHFLHLFAYESENKFNLSNCVHIFAPLLRLHPKLLKVLLLHYKELFPGLVIKRLSKPIDGDLDSADNIDMPNCLSDLEKELATQESALKELHLKMQRSQSIQPPHHKNVEKCLTLKQESAAVVDRCKKIKHAQSFTKGSSSGHHSFYSKYGKKVAQTEVSYDKEKDNVIAPDQRTEKKLEDELWEVQRRVTQLKRKIRLCKQAEYPKKPEELLEPGKILEPRKMGPFQVLAGKFLEPMKATIPIQGQNSSLNDVSLIIPLNENDLQFVEQNFDDRLMSNQGVEGDSISGEELNGVDKNLKETVVTDLKGDKIVRATSDSHSSAGSSLDMTDLDDSISSYSSLDEGNNESFNGERLQDHFVNFSLPHDWENSFMDNNLNTGSDGDSDVDFKDDVAFCGKPLEDLTIFSEAFTRLIELTLPLAEQQDCKSTLKIIPLTVPIVTLLASLIQEKLLLEEGEKLKTQIESDTKVLKQQSKKLREKMLKRRLNQQSSDTQSCESQKISHSFEIIENVDSINEELVPLFFKEDKDNRTVKDLERCNQVIEKTNVDIIDNLYYQNNEIIGLKIKILLISLLKFLSYEKNALSGSWKNYNFKIIGVVFGDIFPCHIMATKRDILAINIFHVR